MARTPVGIIPDILTTPVKVTDDQRRTVAIAASFLLDYPDDDFEAKIAAVDKHIDTLPPAIAAEVAAFTDAARTLGRRGLEEHYVETFDQRRRCSLYLSYYSVGDTRQRGTAILAFRQALEQLGFEEQREELPDHLCVVLEAVARSDGEQHAQTVEMLAAHRDGLEVLRSALQQQNSPFAHLIIAVAMSLPQIDADTAHNYLDLIRSGPPAELVGIGTPLPFPTAHLESS
ncbi:nitrate reductase molybdenum cofactor assembly chaperone [Corynebacterium testudinoris]|uniref:Respiratory nitrate reductase chaperone NarJ n=1 Tax=Corynebacterium testudinoris TaxID=136857 RepID=A0A0G3HBD8_9CORY|nr:nitrate reductase molybdenum cofactor assembly chaperone [Corynebacterium testudinoris]AKK08492.1 respiratory nitrate reductase chaperone NarJ [Corynebacterium testudinoris]